MVVYYTHFVSIKFFEPLYTHYVDLAGLKLVSTFRMLEFKACLAYRKF